MYYFLILIFNDDGKCLYKVEHKNQNTNLCNIIPDIEEALSENDRYSDIDSDIFDTGFSESDSTGVFSDISDQFSDNFLFSEIDTSVKPESDELRASSLDEEDDEGALSDLSDGFHNMASTFLNTQLPERNTEEGTFNFKSLNIPDLGIQDNWDDTRERLSDVTNIDIPHLSAPDYKLDFDSPFDNIGSIVNDFSETFADRPAPDVSIPEFSFDPSNIFSNVNDDSGVSWLSDNTADSSDSIFTTDSASDFPSDHHSHNEDTLYESTWEDR